MNNEQLFKSWANMRRCVEGGGSERRAGGREGEKREGKDGIRGQGEKRKGSYRGSDEDKRKKASDRKAQKKEKGESEKFAFHTLIKSKNDCSLCNWYKLY